MNSLVNSLNLQVKGVPSRVRIASLSILALELEYLQKELGYAGPGSWQTYRDETISKARPRWERFCRMEAGITEATVRNYLKCAKVIAERLRNSMEPDAADLAELMKVQPSKLEPGQRERLVEGIARIGIKEGETFTMLRLQAEMPAPLVSLEASNNQGDSLPENDAWRSSRVKSMEALALACGVSPETSRRVAMIVTAMDFKETMREIREEMAAAKRRH